MNLRQVGAEHRTRMEQARSPPETRQDAQDDRCPKGGWTYILDTASIEGDRP